VQEAIANRAYELFHSRGRWEGFDLSDWLKAETELLRPIAVDVVKNDTEVVVTAEVPGFGPKDLDIAVEPMRVTIRGKLEEAIEKVDGERTLTERSSNEILRSLTLPAEVDPSSATAKLANGVLTVTVKRVQIKEPVKVDVQDT
jgi:HSP20 family protein